MPSTSWAACRAHLGDRWQCHLQTVRPEPTTLSQTALGSPRTTAVPPLHAHWCPGAPVMPEQRFPRPTEVLAVETAWDGSRGSLG